MDGNFELSRNALVNLKINESLKGFVSKGTMVDMNAIRKFLSDKGG